MSGDTATIERPPAAGISPNALIVLALFLGLGAALAMLPEPPRPLLFAFVLAGWIVSVMVHEFGHAFVAWRGGDHTVVKRGYLTLDPLKYSDVQWSMIVPLLALIMGGIGFPGGAVYLRMDLIRTRLGRSLASLAGPAGTLVMLLTLVVAMQFSQGMLFVALAFLAYLQATALVLNLLPIPGLDGYGVFRPWLPPALQQRLRRIEALALWVLLAAIFFVPGLSAQLFETAAELCSWLGVPMDAVAHGWFSFRFWEAMPS